MEYFGCEGKVGREGRRQINSEGLRGEGTR